MKHRIKKENALFYNSLFRLTLVRYKRTLRRFPGMLIFSLKYDRTFPIHISKELFGRGIARGSRRSLRDVRIIENTIRRGKSSDTSIFSFTGDREIRWTEEEFPAVPGVARKSETRPPGQIRWYIERSSSRSECKWRWHEGLCKGWKGTMGSTRKTLGPSW